MKRFRIPRRQKMFAVLPTMLTLGNAVCGFGAITFAAKVGLQPFGWGKNDTECLWIAAMLIANTASASPGERDKLNACQAMVNRAAQTRQTGAAAATPDDAELVRCRQIIREWALRDARTTVDQEGRPLR